MNKVKNINYYYPIPKIILNFIKMMNIKKFLNIEDVRIFRK